MSKTGERLIAVENGEACPKCLSLYPISPVDGIPSSGRCAVCGDSRPATEQEIRDDVNADRTPFHLLGKPRGQRT